MYSLNQVYPTQEGYTEELYKNDLYTLQKLTKPVFAFRHWQNLDSSSIYPSWSYYLDDGSKVVVTFNPICGGVENKR